MGIVVDTHALIWYLQNHSKLSALARQAMQNTSQNGDSIWVASITMVEIIYLVEKGRIPADLILRLQTAMQGANAAFTISPLSGEIAWAVDNIPRNLVPDMPDRIIAATALTLGVPLVSKDRKIQASNIKTIW